MSITVATHDGGFHADDVAACQIINQVYRGEVRFLRTRNANSIKSATYAVDVGWNYDPTAGGFDHHQKGGAGYRSNGVPYASAGLVWKEFGARYCQSVGVEEAFVQDVCAQVDRCVLQGIDAADCGYRGSAKVSRGSLGQIIGDFNPLWNDDKADFAAGFVGAMTLFGEILTRKIRSIVASLEGREIVRAAPAIENEQVMLLEDYAPWKDHMHLRPEIDFVIFPDLTGEWRLQAVEVEGEVFSQRIPLPLEWGGLSGPRLDAVTGINGCVFCHPGLFICGHKTQTGIIQMVRQALA